ncbi:MAG TPA: phosphate acyltransferase PlsX [Telmatospirillum sp.]|nr:phosphate acyltransferase PlsX [Telmatospirillum sp.]
MTARVTISLDAMGGDNAPDMVVQGVQIAHTRLPHVDFLLFGDQAKLTPLLDLAPELKECCQLRHTDKAVKCDDKPSQVLRQGRQTSMWLAVDAVARGEAAGVVSAGNTGALMAMSKYVLRMLPGIDRPAIAGFFPTERGESVMLDLGANVDCDANNLVEFAVMGEVFARIVLGIERPTVGLLNVGSEEMKGNDSVRTAAAILRQGNLPLTFYGFVEGNDIAGGAVDVVVSDGFTGNIALKSAEGLAKLYTRFLRDAFSSSWLARLGYLMARSALIKVKLRTDPRRYNGAMFLGLNGIAVKSHGGTDAVGFANAIGVAVELVTHGFNERIKQELERLKAVEDSPAQAAAI